MIIDRIAVKLEAKQRDVPLSYMELDTSEN